MGLFDKFKNMFTEEIEDEEPIKKEVIQVEIKAPNKKEQAKALEEKEVEAVKKEIIAEKVIEKPVKKEVEVQEEPEKDDKFSFPVFFDDEDFDSLDHAPAKETRTETRTVKPYGGATSTYKAPEISSDSKKSFRPTPVISPIYGVLDKNYKKEDITLRDESRELSKTVSVDDIRNKAYGTLEDELESSLLHDDMYDKPAVYRNEKDMFDEFEVEEPEEMEQMDDGFLDPTMTVEEAERMTRTERINNENETPEESKDLFNLIDSMYKKGDE
jgi:hypothetical protein